MTRITLKYNEVWKSEPGRLLIPENIYRKVRVTSTLQFADVGSFSQQNLWIFSDLTTDVNETIWMHFFNAKTGKRTALKMSKDREWILDDVSLT